MSCSKLSSSNLPCIALLAIINMSLSLTTPNQSTEHVCSRLKTGDKLVSLHKCRAVFLETLTYIAHACCAKLKQFEGKNLWLNLTKAQEECDDWCRDLLTTNNGSAAHGWAKCSDWLKIFYIRLISGAKANYLVYQNDHRDVDICTRRYAMVVKAFLEGKKSDC